MIVFSDSGWCRDLEIAPTKNLLETGRFRLQRLHHTSNSLDSEIESFPSIVGRDRKLNTPITFRIPLDGTLQFVV